MVWWYIQFLLLSFIVVKKIMKRGELIEGGYLRKQYTTIATRDKHNLPNDQMRLNFADRFGIQFIHFFSNIKSM